MFSVDPMSLGKQIKRYRTSLGWTLDKLSERAGVDIGTISALEQRLSKKSQFASNVARGFGLSLEQLLDEGQDYVELIKSGQAPNLATETTPPLNGRWPFEDISPEQWDKLDDNERGRVEAYTRGLLDAKRVHKKSHRTGTAG